MDEPEHVRWGDPRHDSELQHLLSSIIAAAHQDLPNVLTDPSELRPEFRELISLTGQRIHNLHADAIRAIAKDVEFVTVNARLIRFDDFYTVTGGPDAGREGRRDRAHARRLQLLDEILRAEERVETATNAHRDLVEEQIKRGHGAVAKLDSKLRTNHRMGQWLTYTPPARIEIPAGVLEIGLERVRSALHSQQVQSPPLGNPGAAS